MLGALVFSVSLSAVGATKHSVAYMSEYQQLVQVSDRKYRSKQGGNRKDVKLVLLFKSIGLMEWAKTIRSAGTPPGDQRCTRTAHAMGFLIHRRNSGLLLILFLVVVLVPVLLLILPTP